MKFILLLVLLMAAQTHAGWFTDNDEQQRWLQYEQIIRSERESTGGWQMTCAVHPKPPPRSGKEAARNALPVLSELVECFHISDVPDIAQVHPTEYRRRLVALAVA